jgi:hypothetical protein
MPSGSLKLAKSLKDNTGQNVEEKTFIRTTKMEHLEKRGGPRSKCDREETGKKMVLKDLVRDLTCVAGYTDLADGEENVFMKHYEQDLDSDVESVDEAPSPRAVVQSPVAKLSERERRETIRRVAEMNKVSLHRRITGQWLIVKSRGDDDIELDLDVELGLNETVDLDTDTSDVEMLEETQYSVSRASRHSKVIEQVSLFVYLQNHMLIIGNHVKDVDPIHRELSEFCPGRIPRHSSSWLYRWC